MEHNKNDIILALKCHAAGDCLSCPYFGILNCVGVVCNTAAEMLSSEFSAEEKV